MMKAFALSVASFAALTMANINDENSIIREQSQATDDKTFTVGSDTIAVVPKSIFKEDEGESYIRLEFTLTKDIEADKVVEILLIFTTGNDNVVDPVELIYQDAVSCMLQQNSQDTRFWTQTVKDGYYNCNDYTCSAPSGVWNDDSSPSDVDWTAPIEDDDPYAPFCTPHSTDSATYACEQIKCIVERKFDTGYTDDFRFIVNNMDTTDTSDDVND